MYHIRIRKFNFFNNLSYANYRYRKTSNNMSKTFVHFMSNTKFHDKFKAFSFYSIRIIRFSNFVLIKY